MAIQVFRLPRLPVGWKDQPQLFERYWDEAMTTIEKTLNELLVLPEIQSALEEARQATQQALEAAQQAAASTENQASETSLVNSYPQISSGSLITAAADGTVTIANHQRVYGDSNLNPTVAVTGSVLSTGATSGQIVRVFYTDTARSGGNVTYNFTVDPADSPAQGSDIHSVGAVQIPATGTAPGRTPTKPGYVEYQQVDETA